MPSESKIIAKALSRPSKNNLSIFNFNKGTLGHNDIITTVTGVGVTNAAMCTALFLEKFNPRAVIVSGTGSRINPKINCADVIISRRTINHTSGNLTNEGMVYRKVRSPVPKKMTHYQYKPDPNLYKAAKAIAQIYQCPHVTIDGRCYQPKVFPGVVCASDLFGVNQAKINDLKIKINPDLMEMESAAIAQVCDHMDYPHIVFRAASNRAQCDPGIAYRRFGQLAAASAARWTIHFLKNYCG